MPVGARDEQVIGGLRDRNLHLHRAAPAGRFGLYEMNIGRCVGRDVIGGIAAAPRFEAQAAAAERRRDDDEAACDGAPPTSHVAILARVRHHRYVRWLALTVLAACWRDAPPPREPIEEPPPPTAMTRRGPPPTSHDKFDEALEHFRGFTDQICQCTDQPC